jgi:hypothetical protein
MAYITGCFDQRTGNSDSDCSRSDSNDEANLEVRAYLIRVYMPEADYAAYEDLGPITASSSNPNGAYTLQLVE